MRKQHSLKKSLLLATSLLIMNSAAYSQKTKEIYLDPKQPVDNRVKDLMSKMTLEEKVAQLCQYVGPGHIKENVEKKGKSTDKGVLDAVASDILSSNQVAQRIAKGEVGSCLHVTSVEEANVLQRIAQNSRLKIPLIMGIDAIHGNGLHYGTTIYPTAIGMASTFNPELLKISGEQTACEMRATGMHWTFNPNIEITRDPRWGRTGETFGEDTYLVTQMGVALTKGLQGESGFDGSRVLACAKHMIGGGEPMGGINAAPMDMSEQKLREVYLPPFVSAIKEAKAATVMPAHNELNGIPCHANSYLLKDILRDELNFKGFTISDWMDIERLSGSMHNLVPTEKEAFVVAFDAGVDMHMHGPFYLEAIVEAIKNGKVSEQRLDRAVAKVLEAKFQLGLFENPFVEIKDTQKALFTKEHQQSALDAARQSIVLLKNSNNTLPLEKGKYKRILVTGPNANSQTILGDWAFKQPDENVVTVLEGIKMMCPDAAIDTVCTSDYILKMNPNLVDAAGQKAKEADLNIVVLGENSLRYHQSKTCGENIDRDNIDLAGLQQQLLEKVYASGKPTILVLVNGRPLSVNWAEKNMPAIIEAWEPGLFGGQAIAEILFGDVNPSGKLPMTFPRNVGQIPTIYNHKGSQYSRKFVDTQTGALYHFGYGLSYTTYNYGEPKLSRDIIKPNESTKVTFSITNSGNRDGVEIVQLYIQDEFASVTRPIKELKGFQRVALKVGETKNISFDITPEELQFFTARKKWEVEPGTFKIMVGTSSHDKDLKKTKLTVQ